MDDPEAFQFTQVRQNSNHRDKIHFDLLIRQQPEHSRMCGVGEKADRRPIDPPPIIQLEVYDPTLPGNKRQFLHNPYYFMYTTLVSTDGVEELSILADRRARTITGSSVSSLSFLKDESGTDGAFFVFPDLSVRCEGVYKLKFMLFEIVGSTVFFCKSILSSNFTVYSAKKFPGMDESTPLTKLFAEQGLKIRVRKEQKLSKLRNDGNRHQNLQPDNPHQYYRSGIFDSRSYMRSPQKNIPMGIADPIQNQIRNEYIYHRAPESRDSGYQYKSSPQKYETKPMHMITMDQKQTSQPNYSIKLPRINIPQNRNYENLVSFNDGDSTASNKYPLEYFRSSSGSRQYGVVSAPVPETHKTQKSDYNQHLPPKYSSESRTFPRNSLTPNQYQNYEKHKSAFNHKLPNIIHFQNSNENPQANRLSQHTQSTYINRNPDNEYTLSRSFGDGMTHPSSARYINQNTRRSLDTNADSLPGKRLKVSNYDNYITQPESRNYSDLKNPGDIGPDIYKNDLNRVYEDRYPEDDLRLQSASRGINNNTLDQRYIRKSIHTQNKSFSRSQALSGEQNRYANSDKDYYYSGIGSENIQSSSVNNEGGFIRGFENTTIVNPEEYEYNYKTGHGKNNSNIKYNISSMTSDKNKPDLQLPRVRIRDNSKGAFYNDSKRGIDGYSPERQHYDQEGNEIPESGMTRRSLGYYSTHPLSHAYPQNEKQTNYIDSNNEVETGKYSFDERYASKNQSSIRGKDIYHIRSASTNLSVPKDDLKTNKRFGEFDSRGENVDTPTNSNNDPEYNKHVNEQRYKGYDEAKTPALRLSIGVSAFVPSELLRLFAGIGILVLKLVDVLTDVSVTTFGFPVVLVRVEEVLVGEVGSSVDVVVEVVVVGSSEVGSVVDVGVVEDGIFEVVGSLVVVVTSSGLSEVLEES
ncbi:hypothetical protein BB559_000962 [Furculomyces boomerangus]|uniref:Velvet domain-containing protein n=1 Tax=Furculomyces boomerangus TaxID=61424 RepID=A0A2T9Z3G3_9FUNG|nr:hypothetical protein BB559_000962 [Furculomyces boomerangus]